MSATLTEQLVTCALDTYRADEARRFGGRALFDHLACLRAGLRVTPDALGDAAAAVALDRDDVHWASLTHPGAIVWTAVRAAGAEGELRWRAAHAGYEVTARLGVALGSDHRRYWHATTTAGTVGAAVAGALVLGTDPVAAAGHAISVTGGSIVALLERSGTRMLHRDHAVQAGLRCAQVAADLGATRCGLEHPRGLFAAMGGNASSLLEPRPAALAEVAFRRHATNGFAQALVEAAAELAPVEDTAAEVIAEAPAAAVAMAANPEPGDADEAWWSCEHAVAVRLLGLDLEDRSLAGDPRVAALRRRVRLRAGTASRVTVAGRSAERAGPAPLTDDDLVTKWRTLNPDDAPPLELLA